MCVCVYFFIIFPLIIQNHEKFGIYIHLTCKECIGEKFKLLLAIWWSFRASSCYNHRRGSFHYQWHAEHYTFFLLVTEARAWVLAYFPSFRYSGRTGRPSRMAAWAIINLVDSKSPMVIAPGLQFMWYGGDIIIGGEPTITIKTSSSTSDGCYELQPLLGTMLISSVEPLNVNKPITQV